MKRQLPFIAGLVICLAIAGYYGYLIITSNKKLAASPPANQAPAVNQSLLQVLRDKNKNGSLPIEVTSDELGNSQPF